MEADDSIRRTLTALCRTRRRRTREFDPERPTKWQAAAVQDPRSSDGFTFTDAGAWDFIAECLEAGCPIEQITLAKPRGKTAYVILTAGAPGRPSIYIKLQLGSHQVIARSFHYTTYAKDD